MRRYLLFAALVAALLFLNVENALAFEQTQDTCYAYCAGWKLYWSGDPVWKYIEENCAMDAKDTLKAIFDFAKDTYKGEIPGLDIIAQSIGCAVYIKMDIVDKLDACRASCTANKWSYASDPVVAYTQGNYYRPGVYYSESGHNIGITVFNDGFGYATGVDVVVYTGSTLGRDCEITKWTQLTAYRIDKLAPFGARRNDEQTPYQDYRSVPWTAPDDYCSKIKVVVDEFDQIPEIGESDGVDDDNEYIETINLLPDLPSYQITDFGYQNLGLSVDDVRLWFAVKNSGDEVGFPELTIRKCNGPVLHTEDISIDGHGQKGAEIDLYDLFGGDFAVQKSVCLEIEVDDGSDSATIKRSVMIFSGVVRGTVYDMYGEPVKDIIVTASTGQTDTTNSKGEYEIEGLTLMGPVTLTAADPHQDIEGSVTVNLSLTSPAYEGLVVRKADIVLVGELGSLVINCPHSGYVFRMDSGYYNYRGGEASNTAILQGVVPGSYRVVITKAGFSSSFQQVLVQPGEQSDINCLLQPMAVYSDDSGIDFAPQMNDLWSVQLEQGYNLYQAAISKDGSTVVALVANPSPGLGKVLVYSREGQKLGEIPFSYPGGQINGFATPVYDGSKILLGTKYIFTRTGQLLAENADPKANPDPVADIQNRGVISQDGSLMCYLDLYLGDFTKLTKDLLYGGGDSDVMCNYAGLWFSMDGSALIGCHERDTEGICRTDFATEQVVVAGDEYDNPRAMQDTPDGSVIFSSFFDDRLVYFRDGQAVWEEGFEVPSGVSRPSYNFAEVSLSPGGGYAVALDGGWGPGDYMPYVFDSQGNSLLPEERPDEWSWRVKAMEATGTGVYYVKAPSATADLIFGVLGQPGTAQKQQLQMEQELPEWEMGTSGDGTIPAVVATTVVLLALGFFAWKAGVLVALPK